MGLVLPHRLRLKPNLRLGEQNTFPKPIPPPPGQFFFAMNLSGAENQYPTFPTKIEMAWWQARGITTFRVPFSWSKPNPTYGVTGIQPTAFGALDTTSTYLPLRSDNLIYQSENLATSPWGSTHAVVANNAAITPPIGATSVSSISDVTGVSQEYTAWQGFNSTAGDVVSIFFHAAVQTWGVIQFNTTSGLGFNASAAYFNLATGALGSIQQLAGTAPVISSSVITPVASSPGWYRCSVVIAQTGNNGGFFFSPASGDNGRSYVGTGQIAVYATGAMVNHGGTLLPYAATLGGYVQAVDDVFNAADKLGVNIILDCHMFGGGPNGVAIGSPCLPVSAFVDMWTKVLTRYAQRPSLFAVEWMNEPVNGFDSSIIQDWSQQLNNIARSAPINFTGEIHLDGTNYTGTWNWVSGQGQPFNNANFYTVTDPLNKQRFEGHCYFDFNNSGANYAYDYQTTVPGVAPPGFNTSPTIGVTRLNNEFLPWLGQHGAKAILGEFGISNDPIIAGGTNNFQAWFTVGFNFGDLARSNNTPMAMWGGGPGFAPNNYPFCPSPYNVTNQTTPDFTSAGIQSVHMAFINRYVNNPVPQLLAYALQSPVTVTPSGNPQQPIVTTDVYETAGVASNPFTVVGGGTIPAGTVITPHAFLSDGVTPAGGTFTPSTVTFASAQDYLFGQFTYTPATSNITILISTTNNKGFIDPPSRTITTKDDAWKETGLLPTPLYNMYRSYAPFAGPSLQLQSPLTGAVQNWSFTNGDNFDRVAIQAWAGRQDQIPVLQQYDQSPLNSSRVFSGGTTLNLQNTDGYPELVHTAMHADFNSFISRSGAVTMMTRLKRSASAGQVYLNEAQFTGPIAFDTTFQITNTSWISNQVVNSGAAQLVGSVSLGVTNGAYHNYCGVYTPDVVTNAFVSYLDGTQHATANATATITESFTLTQSGTNGVVTNLIGNITLGDIATGSGVPANNAFVSQNPDGSYVMSQSASLSNVACNGVGVNYRLNTAFDSPSVQNGYYLFGGGNWQGSDQALGLFPGSAVTSGQVTTILSFENTHYSTPLPDTLPPIFVGVTNQQTVSGSPSNPFASVILQDAAGSTVSVTITLSGHAATLSGTGLSGSNPYTLAADTPANVTAKLQALAFNTTGSGGDVTNVAMVATSSTTLTGTANPTVTIRVATAPVISGLVGPNVSMDQGAPPLWQVTVTDTNPSPMVSASIVVTGSAGVLSHIGPYAPSGSGPYTFAAMTPTELTRALRNLLWAPGTHTAGTTTTFALTVTNALTLTASASNTITNVAPAAMPTPLTPVATPAAMLSPANTYRGMNFSGGEFNPPLYVTGKSLYDWAQGNNFGTIRLPFLFTFMAAVNPASLTNSVLYANFNSSQITALQACVENCRADGQWALLDDHSFGGMLNPFPTGTVDDTTFPTWGTDIRVPASAFADIWKRMVVYFSSYSNIIVGLQNECLGGVGPGSANANWRVNATAASAAIRTVAPSILIQLPSANNVVVLDQTTWTGYTDTGPFLFDVHQYFDNSGGTLSTCVATPVSAYFSSYVSWLRTNGYKSTITEFAWGTDPSCMSSFGASVMTYFNANNDVLTGWNWWGGGFLGGSYPYYMGPEPGGGNPPQYALLAPYLP